MGEMASVAKRVLQAFKFEKRATWPHLQPQLSLRDMFHTEGVGTHLKEWKLGKKYKKPRDYVFITVVYYKLLYYYYYYYI